MASEQSLLRRLSTILLLSRKTSRSAKSFRPISLMYLVAVAKKPSRSRYSVMRRFRRRSKYLNDKAKPS